MKKIILMAVLAVSSYSFAQEADTETETKSNIQTFTPSVLLRKGQWDIKFFNSLYTQTEQTGERSNSRDIDRENYFTSTTEVYRGVSENSRVNVGVIVNTKSNTVAGQSPSSVFKFKDNTTDSRFSLTSIAPSIRVQPFASVPKFSFTSSFHIPVFKDVPNAPYLDVRSYIWETKFFFDRTFGAGKWQVFTELDFAFNFGQSSKDAKANNDNVNFSERFANNSLALPASVFLSYFPSSKSTVFVNAQQRFLISLGNEFEQNYTQVGFGGKYQLTEALNLEASVGKIVRGVNYQGLGQTFSLGLRALL